MGPQVIPVPKPSGKISMGNFADDLRDAFANTRGADDPWRAVARRAVELAPRVLPEEPDILDTVS